MAITFHCDHCGKKVGAQDSAAGKWVKCPACRNKIYVPNLSGDEELKLAPIDESDEEKKRRLMEETHRRIDDSNRNARQLLERFLERVAKIPTDAPASGAA